MRTQRAASVNDYSLSGGINGGCHGQFRHQFIVDWLRWELPPILQECTGERPYVLADTIWIHAMQTDTKRKDIDVPDLVFVFSDGIVLVEVGKCQLAKWHSLLHIDFQGLCRLVNPHLSSAAIYFMTGIIEQGLHDAWDSPIQIGMGLDIDHRRRNKVMAQLL